MSNEEVALKLLDEAATEEEVTDVKRLMAVMKKANKPTETFIVSRNLAILRAANVVVKAIRYLTLGRKVY